MITNLISHISTLSFIIGFNRYRVRMNSLPTTHLDKLRNIQALYIIRYDNSPYNIYISTHILQRMAKRHDSIRNVMCKLLNLYNRHIVMDDCIISIDFVVAFNEIDNYQEVYDNKVIKYHLEFYTSCPIYLFSNLQFFL